MDDSKDETVLEANAAKSKIEELMAKLADLKVEFTKVENIKTNIDESIAGPSNALQISDKGNENTENSKKRRKRNRTKPKKGKFNEEIDITVEASNNEFNVNLHVATDSKTKKKDKPAKNHVEVNTNKPRLNSNGHDPSLSVVLTPETVLIYKLLIMSPADRDKFIYKQAKERRILIHNAQNDLFEFNPIFYGGIPTNKTIKRHDDNMNHKEMFRSREERRSKRNRKHKSRDEKSKSRHNKLYDLFETQVNRLLYGESKLTAKEKEETIFLYNENDDKQNKLFSTEDNQRNLEEFVQKLIDKNLGYIIENEIRINQKNNHEGYVTNNLNSEGDILVPSIVLRQCALHGDSVKVFAVKPNVYNGNKKIENEVEDIKVISVDKEDGGTENEDEDKDLSLDEAIDAPTPNKPRVLGFVLKITEKLNTRQCIGTFKKVSKTSASIFKPRDLKLPQIKINPIHMPESLLNQKDSNDMPDGGENNIENILFYAEIIDSSFHELIGRIIKPIGKCGELENENQAILLQNGLDPIKYSDDVLQEIPTIPYVIKDSEYLNRVDLRDQCIFTIDPATARDLDDAVSSKILPNGNYEIGVHISDVSYFITENSVIDEQIKNQTTSIYLVDKVYHMLPEKLCFLCSLTPGEDKLAFSVIWEITKNGKILKTEFKRTVINSCSQLSYEHAQAVIENPDETFEEICFPHIYNNYKPKDLIEIIKQLNTIALVLRQQRFDNGALRINQPKLKFNLDHSTGKPISYFTERQQSSNYLIEDFMLLANQSVAAFIFEKYPELAVLRKHDRPNENALKKVTAKLSTLNLNFDISSSKSIRESLEKLPKQSKSEEAASSILNFITAKQMTRAKYICSDQVMSIDDLNHYALSIPIYTHFTSPIRRYPDILVHRLLCAGLDLDKAPERTSIELNKILKNCNQQKMDAKSAGDDSANLYFIHYLKTVGSLKMRAAVLEIKEYSMEVIVMDTGHILRIPYKARINRGGPAIKLKYCLENDKPIVMVTNEELKIKPLKLEMLSECTIEISVKNEKLHGDLVLNDDNDSNSGQN